MPLIIPLQPTPSQTVSVLLSDQQTVLNVAQKTTGMFMDVLINNTQLIIGGVICENQNPVIRSAYLGYIGDFAWLDTQPDPISGPSDPFYTAIGTRFFLGYYLPSELPAGLA